MNHQLLQQYAVPNAGHFIQMQDLLKAHQCCTGSCYITAFTQYIDGLKEDLACECATPGHVIVPLHHLVNSRVFHSATQLSTSGSIMQTPRAKQSLETAVPCVQTLISVLALNRWNQRTRRGHEDTLVISAGQVIFCDTIFGNQIHDRSVPTQAITFQRALKCLATNMRQLLRL
jgi:hypothetical protein